MFHFTGIDFHIKEVYVAVDEDLDLPILYFPFSTHHQQARFPLLTMSIPITSETVVQDQRVVQYVRVVVHTLGPAGPSISDNHWSIYLLLANNNSVRINMTAEPGFIDGTLKWTQQSYLLTTSAIRYWEFPVSQGVQFRHIANLIHQLGRQRYDMSGGGSGCRYWV